MTTIFETIAQDHDKHRTMLMLVGKTKGASDGRAELFARLRHELLSHAAAEERSFYSVLMDIKDTRSQASHSVEEHEEMRDGLERLSKMEHDNPNWIRVFASLRERIEHHMAEEENEIFAAARQALTQEQAEHAAKRFHVLKSKWTEEDEEDTLVA